MAHPKRYKLCGQRFGRWRVLRYAGAIPFGSGVASAWECVCDCGTKRTVAGVNLVTGRSASCGCLAVDRCREVVTTHGHSSGGEQSPEYMAWSHMLRRCTNPNNKDFADYGGRGIQVCAQWRSDFIKFLEDIGPKPSPKHTLDRFPNNNGNYEPGNVRWATRREQARNRRSNRVITFRGISRPLVEWAEDIGISKGTLLQRILGGLATREGIGELIWPFSTM
jgi:hypothetical protein